MGSMHTLTHAWHTIWHTIALALTDLTLTTTVNGISVGERVYDSSRRRSVRLSRQQLVA